MATLEQGVIGNGTIAALIDREARIGWFCLPRLDGEPVFNALLGGAGGFAITLEGMVSAQQAYVRNTAILETVLTAQDGSSIRITDFAPRFTDRGRMFRPAAIVRQVTPLAGMPRITVELSAQNGLGQSVIAPRRGVSHISYPNEDAGFRVTTDAPVSHILDQRSFVLDRSISLILGPDESLSDNPALIASDWLRRTRETWKEWSRRLATPPE